MVYASDHTDLHYASERRLLHRQPGVCSEVVSSCVSNTTLESGGSGVETLCFGMFRSALKRAQGVQRVFQYFLLFARAAEVKEFSAAGENRLLSVGHFLRDDVLVCFENGRSVQRLPISMMRAWGKSRWMKSVPDEKRNNLPLCCKSQFSQGICMRLAASCF
jgi:hypothetical protein